MRNRILKYVRASKLAVLPLLSILLGIVICKQIGIYERIVKLYEALIPLVIGMVIAFFLQPMIDRLQKYFPKRLSVVIIYGGFLIMIFLFITSIVPILYQQIDNIVRMVPNWLNQVETFLLKVHIPYEQNISLKDTIMSEGIDVIVSSLMAGVGTITKLAIGYLTAFFISLDLDFWIYTSKKIIPNYHRFTNFYKTMSNIIYHYLVGTAIDLLFIAVSVGIVLYIAGFPNALLYAVVLALFNLWPYIGATIGLILIAVVSSLSFSTIPVLPLFIVWLIQQLESNIIQPLIFNKTMDVRPVLTFISLFVSEAMLGIAGVILSPIFAAIAQIIFRSYLHSKTSDKVGEWEDIWFDFDEVMNEEASKN